MQVLTRHLVLARLLLLMGRRKCHTKGIVVDRKRVMVGSQNLSNDGVSVNRDASLLFDDEDLAKYFGSIFDHDWQNVPKQDIGHESLRVEGGAAVAVVERPPGLALWAALVHLPGSKGLRPQTRSLTSTRKAASYRQ